MIDLRYVGFKQVESKRLFHFDCHARGRPALRIVVSAEIALFSAHHVNLQEGPAICARKLTVAPDVDVLHHDNHELTAEDLRVYASAQAIAADRKAAALKRPHYRLPERRARSPYSGHWG